MSDFSKLRVYVHVAVMNNWRTLLDEVMEDARIGGLLDAAAWTIVAVGGEVPDAHGCRVVNTGLPVSAFEFPTLALLYEENTDDSAVCYLHLKGVSQPASLLHRAWRRELLDFTVIDWRSRLSHLAERHTSGARITQGGCGWRGEWVPAHRHYSGNFWWARGDYIARLPHPEAFRKKHDNRYAAEAWIGQSKLINERVSS
jgi:hypothetical protein